MKEKWNGQKANKSLSSTDESMNNKKKSKCRQYSKYSWVWMIWICFSKKWNHFFCEDDISANGTQTKPAATRNSSFFLVGLKCKYLWQPYEIQLHLNISIIELCENWIMFFFLYISFIAVHVDQFNVNFV